jgi:hypothetical protein
LLGIAKRDGQLRSSCKLVRWRRLGLSTATTNMGAQVLYEAAGWERDDDFAYIYPIRK